MKQSILQGVSFRTHWNGHTEYEGYLPQYLPLFEAIMNGTTTWTEFVRCHKTQSEVNRPNTREVIYATIAISFQNRRSNGKTQHYR